MNIYIETLNLNFMFTISVVFSFCLYGTLALSYKK